MGTIAQDLALAAANKTAIKAAIVAKNPTTAPTDVMSQWPTAIASIPASAPAVITPLSVTANGTYTAPSGTDGYSPVTVNVPTETDYYGDDIIVVVDLSKSYTSLTVSFSVGIYSNNCVVSWGDGAADETFASHKTHTYAAHAVYTITIKNNGSGIIEFDGFTCPKQSTVVKIGAKFKFSTQFTLNNPDSIFYFSSNQSLYNITNIFKIDSRQVYGVASVDGSNGRPLSQILQIRSAKGLPIYYKGTRVYSWYNNVANAPAFASVEFSNTNVELEQYAFLGCTTLVKLIGTKLSLLSGNQVFYGCSNLKSIPTHLDATALTADATNTFYSCTSLESLPTHFTCNVSFSFAGCTGVVEKDSVSTFTDGAITGGLIYNLNTCANNGKTLTLNSAIRALFDATEQAAIESALTAKNWTCAW